jgi:multicomponent Na+:H+ antiporter subunit C
MNAVVEHLPYAVAAWLFVVGLYGVATSKNLVHMVVCVAVVQTATYTLLLTVGFKHDGSAPVFVDAPPTSRAVDPVVQALMLTDVVVEATVVALLLALVVQAHKRSGTLDPDRLHALRG